LYQIDGDNLSGFKKFGYDLSILGGYRFDLTNQMVVSMSYEQRGSNRKNESPPRIFGDYLAEVDIKQTSLMLGYARAFGLDWDGTSQYKATVGLKYNRILSTDASLLSSSILDNYELMESEFRSSYLSLRISGSISLGHKSNLSLNYEHALQSVLAESEAVPFSRLIPFGLSISFAYYII